jgi:hypothetical protein
VRLTHHESPVLKVDWAQRTFSLRTGLPSHLGKMSDDMAEDPVALNRIWVNEQVEFASAPPDHVLIIQSAVWDPEEWKMTFEGKVEGPP